MMMDIEWMVDVVCDVKDKLIGLGEAEFVSVMCMLFDEYHNAHRDLDAVKMAEGVAETVKFINDRDGEYLNAA